MLLLLTMVFAMRRFTIMLPLSLLLFFLFSIFVFV